MADTERKRKREDVRTVGHRVANAPGREVFVIKMYGKKCDTIVVIDTKLFRRPEDIYLFQKCKPIQFTTASRKPDYPFTGISSMEHLIMSCVTEFSIALILFGRFSVRLKYYFGLPCPEEIDRIRCAARTRLMEFVNAFIDFRSDVSIARTDVRIDTTLTMKQYSSDVKYYIGFKISVDPLDKPGFNLHSKGDISTLDEIFNSYKTEVLRMLPRSSFLEDGVCEE
jgi:hypothetical protein